MEVKTLSPSKLKQARLCDARLLAKLSDDEYEEETGEPARIGNLAHESSKLWFRPNPEWVKEMAEVYKAGQEILVGVAPELRSEVWNQHLSTENRRLSQNGILKHPRRPQAKDESDDDYRNSLITDCFRRGMKEVQSSDILKKPESLEDAKMLFNVIVGHYNREEVNVVFSELRYKGALANGVPIHQILDMGIDRGNGVLEIVDFKTGFLTLSTDDMINEDQVLMNLLAVIRDPQFKNYTTKRFTYFWVRMDYEAGPLEVPINRLEDYEYWLATEYQRLLDLTPETTSETPNQFCKSCGRRFECVKYGELYSEAMGTTEVMKTEQMVELTVNERMAQYARISAQTTLLEEGKKFLRDLLLQDIEQAGAKSIDGEKFKVTRQQRSNTSYDTGSVLNLCQQHGVSPNQFLTVGKGKVDGKWGNDTEAMHYLRNHAKTSLSAASVRVSPISPKGKKKGKSTKEQDSQTISEVTT